MPLLDTTFLIDVMRGKERAIDLLERLEAGGDALAITTITLFEMHRGLAAVGISEARRRDAADAVAGRVVHAPDANAARRAGEIDALLWAAGEPIDPEDALIAGIALTRDLELVTRNRNYARVPGLRMRTY